MGKHIYGTVIRPSEDGGYWAEVPDLPGCFGQGEDYMAALESISDSIETHLASLKEIGLPIPMAGPLPNIEDGEVVYVFARDDSVRLGAPTVSAAEAARMLGVSPGRVSQLISSGRLVAERLAGRTNVTLASIEAYQASPRTAGRPRKVALAG